MESLNGAVPPPLEGATVVAACDTVLASPLGGEVVLLEPEEGVYYSLNEVGARIWDIIRDPVSVDMICGLIAREYDVDLEECRADVHRLLTELLDHGLAETHPPPP
jgi:hypothetical protein